MSDLLQEDFILFYYNLTRKEYFIKNNNNNNNNNVCSDFLKLTLLFERILQHTSMCNDILIRIQQLILETRIYKGEHEITYMLLFTFFKYYPKLASELIHKMYHSNSSISWRDIKYLCHYVRRHSLEKEKHPIIGICIQIVHSTLKKDIDIIDQSQQNSLTNIQYSEPISYLAKWIPRENKKFDWLNELLVLDWYKNNTNKSKMLYRKMVSKANRCLDLMPCSKNIHNTNTIKNAVITDRLSYFIKEAFLIMESGCLESCSERIDILNRQWIQMNRSNTSNNDFIPFLDLSFHHTTESLYTAIAIALLISEKSSYTNRIMVIDSQPLWVNLDNYESFFDKMVFFHTITKSNRGTSANIIRGIELLSEAMTSSTCTSTCTIVYIHGGQSIEYKRILDIIPTSSRIVFWNLSNKYIDSISLDKRFFYMSGLSSALLSNLDLLQKKRWLDSFQFVCTILDRIV